MIPQATRPPPHRPGGVSGGRVPENATGRRTEDRNLARRAASGDVSAFDRLAREHSGLVHGVAIRVLGARDAPDASQEVWIKVWRNMGSFRGQSAFTTWLYRVATNTCLGLRRTRSRREERQHHGEEAPYLPEPAGGDADPEAAALDAERSREVEFLLGRVRAEHRAALVLRHMEGRPYAEIAEILGVPDGTAKVWVSRGRDAMLFALAKGKGAG
ncbi:MAG: RNA polymerase sigma factor [Rubrobacter sp.]|nr:RNA polymerase sigma factor [Rubrobacter sp.]